MYDMTTLIPRYFNIKLLNGVIIDVTPPKLKVLKKIIKLGHVKDTTDMTEEDFENMISALSMALSKNKQNYKVTAEWLDENLDIDELQDILTAYFNWVGEIENQKN